MATAQQNGQAAREELERVLSNTCFARSEGLSRLLRFLVERQLEGRASELKESLIGMEVYGRRPDYNPKLDSTVRSEVARLRARLSRYYSTEGNQDPLVIELPKGGYVPTFRQSESDRAVPKPGRRRRWLAAGTASLVAGAAVFGALWFLHKSSPIRIAVLPLVNMNQDSSTDYVADGLTGEIIRNLSIIDGLEVRSQTSSFTFKGKPLNAREAGRELEADYILEGSVLRSERQLRINTQLIRVHDDFALWSGRYDRELTNILAIQDDISRGIVNSLRLKVGHGRRRYETNEEAYDLYLRARSAQRNGSGDSIGLFEEAIAKDPAFAPAYAGLAGTHAMQWM